MLSKQMLNYLVTNQFFEHVDREKIKQLDECLFEFREFENGHTLVKENEKSAEFYLIVSGIVKVTKTLPNGEESEITRRTANEYVGELSLMQDIHRSANVYCLSAVKVISINRDNFFFLVDKFPVIGSNLSQTIARRLTESDNKTIYEMEKYETLLAMHKEIYTQKQELERLNRKLKEDIIKRKEVEEKLKIISERLKMLNKIIRHDLSNDFAVIKSALRIFRQSDDSKMLDEIEKRVIKSIDAINEYRKYESFIESNVYLEEIELEGIISNIIQEYPGINFNLKGKGRVFATDNLNSVFRNLISNSIMHGKATQIDIIISSDNSKCYIEFIDNGKGIPSEIKDKIFDEGFFHGESGHTGVGLYIVKQVLENYGGSITAENNLPSGAVFKIHLKRAIKD